MYKKYLVVVGALLIQSCSIVGLFQANKKIEGDYVLELHPRDSHPVHDRSINVIQGFASFEDGFFTSQTTADTYLILNYIDSKGDSQFATRFTVNSHAQDLSLEQISEDSLVLYTTIGAFDKDGASGIMTLGVKLPPKENGVRDMSKISVGMLEKYQLGYRNCTPTISTDNKKIALRSGNSIYFGNKEDVLSRNKDKISHFDISMEQLRGQKGETLWFQGIAMDENNIYCLTGNGTIDSEKKIFVYNLNGEVVKKVKIEEKQMGRGSLKLEPEGLTIVDGNLYFLLMVKAKVGGNRKFMFKANL